MTTGPTTPPTQPTAGGAASPDSSAFHLPADAVRRPWVPWAVFLSALAVYGYHLAPTVRDGDAAERVMTLLSLGLCHPPGVPFYTLIGFVWIRLLGFLEPAVAANALSAVSAAGAVALTFLICRRIAASDLASAVAALSMAFHPLLWSQALYSEVYPLNLLFLCATLWYFQKWARQGTPRDLWAASLLYALSLMAHQAAVLWAPALLVYVLARKRTVFRQPRALAGAIVLALIGMAPLAYIAIRGCATSMIFAQDRPDSLKAFFDFLRGAQFDEENAFDLLLFVERPVFFVAVAFYGYLGIGLASVVAGVQRLGYRRRLETIAAGIGCVMYIAYFAKGKSFDFKTLVIPVLVPMTLAAAIGWEDWLSHRASAPGRRWRRRALGAAICLPLLQILIFPSLQSFVMSRVDSDKGGPVFKTMAHILAHVPVTFRGDDGPREFAAQVERALAGESGPYTLMLKWYGYTVLFYYQYAGRQLPHARLYEMIGKRRINPGEKGVSDVVVSDRMLLRRDVGRRPVYLIVKEPITQYSGYPLEKIANLPRVDEDKCYLYRVYPKPPRPGAPARD